MTRPTYGRRACMHVVAAVKLQCRRARANKAPSLMPLPPLHREQARSHNKTHAHTSWTWTKSYWLAEWEGSVGGGGGRGRTKVCTHERVVLV